MPSQHSVLSTISTSRISLFRLAIDKRKKQNYWSLIKQIINEAPRSTRGALAAQAPALRELQGMLAEANKEGY